RLRNLRGRRWLDGPVAVNEGKCCRERSDVSCSSRCGTPGVTPFKRRPVERFDCAMASGMITGWTDEISVGLVLSCDSVRIGATPCTQYGFNNGAWVARRCCAIRDGCCLKAACRCEREYGRDGSGEPKRSQCTHGDSPDGVLLPACVATVI